MNRNKRSCPSFLLRGQGVFREASRLAGSRIRSTRLPARRLEPLEDRRLLNGSLVLSVAQTTVQVVETTQRSVTVSATDKTSNQAPGDRQRPYPGRDWGLSAGARVMHWRNGQGSTEPLSRQIVVHRAPPY
jgi:hypothetical protein